MKPIVVLGSRGYAQEVLWIIDDLNSRDPEWEFLGFVDPAEPSRKGTMHYDRPILGGFDDVPRGTIHFACGIGIPQARAKECARAEELGWIPVTLVHPSVVRARHVELGDGSIVGAGSILCPYATVGRHVSINVHASIGHDAVVGDFSVISPGARISGGVRIGRRALVGSNATVFPKRTIGDDARLGSNSLLISNLADSKSALGIPAAILRI